jgi:hypothetical protein
VLGIKPILAGIDILKQMRKLRNGGSTDTKGSGRVYNF